jgi:hypothetical protein
MHPNHDAYQEPAGVLCTVIAYKGVWAVQTRQCPYCKKRNGHSHGAGRTDKPPLLGTRLSHCVKAPRKPYILIPILTRQLTAAGITADRAPE